MTRLGTVCFRRAVPSLVGLALVLLLNPALSLQAQDVSLRVQAQQFFTTYQEAQAAFEADPSEATQRAYEEATEAFAAFRAANREALKALPPGALQVAPASQFRLAPTQDPAVPRPLPLNQIFQETFDSDLGSTFPSEPVDNDAHWHFRDDCPANPLPGHSAPGTARWGRLDNCFSYDPGPADTDFLLTPPVNVSACPGGAALSFSYFLDYQEGNSFDDAKAQADGGSGFVTLADNGDDFGNIVNGAGWNRLEDLIIPINSTSTIQVRFEGSSADGLFDNGQGFFVDDINVVCVDDADLAITKTVDDDTPEVGDTVTFTVEVTNNGLGNVIGVDVSDILPAGLAFAGASFSDPSDSYDAGSGLWSIGNLAFGETATLTLSATVTTADPVTNEAHIAYSNLPDPDESNNSASVTLNPVSADLAIAKTVTGFAIDDCDDEDDGPDCQAKPVIVSFLVKVTNNGPDAVSGIEVLDTLPADFDVLTLVASDGDITLGPGTITWDNFGLGVGAMATLDVTLVGPEGTTIINTATVTAAGLVDTDDRNNSATAFAGPRDDPRFSRGRGPGLLVDRTGRRFQSDLSLTKSVDASTASVGDVLTYTVTVTNNGPNNNAGIEVTDDIPDCLAIGTVTASAGTSYSEPLWDVGNLAVGATATLTVEATVTDACSGEVTNEAAITSANLADPDDYPIDPFNPPAADDEASATTSIAAGASARLMENYPNPFNPQTVIPVELGATAEMRLVVYDLLGRQVEVLAAGEYGAGRHEFTFEASRLATGVYLVRLEAAGFVQTQRITLMK